MFPWLPKAVPICLCLSLILPRTGRAQAGLRQAPAPRAASQDRGSDAFPAAMLGALPLMSGFYLTSSPQKGLAFTLADAMLIGTIVKIRSDKGIPPKDAAVYYYLLGAVNVADLALSVLQVRADVRARISLDLNPADQPGLLLAWHF